MAELAGIVIGAGDRGYDAYAPYLLDHPGQGRIVAVADPDPERRRQFCDRYGLSDDAAYAGYHEVLSLPRFADYVIVTTGDRHHVEPTLLALEAGYHVLLEKPMAHTEADCRRIAEAADAAGLIVQVCHIMRYAPFWQRLRRVVDHGDLGDVVTIQLSENIAYYHYAHSYCRGNTRSSSHSPLLLQKSCHDLDLLCWLADAPPARVASFIRPTELTAVNKPDGAPEFCIEGCPHADTCQYDATAMYLELAPMLQDLALTRKPPGLGIAARAIRKARPQLARIPVGAVQDMIEWRRWPVAPVSRDTSRAGLEEALRTTNWGRCVYQVADNDQPSSQTVLVSFANGVNASFTLSTTSHRSMRSVRIDGTRGSAVGHLYALDQTLDVVDHKTGRRRREKLAPTFDGHGGGDHELFAGFLGAIRGEHEPLTTAADSVASHRIAFAAVDAATRGAVVELT